MLACLRQQKARDLALYRKKVLLKWVFNFFKNKIYTFHVFGFIVVCQGVIFPTAFAPRIDKERRIPFLPDDPYVLISSKRFNAVPIIAGLTEHEAAYCAACI